MGKEKDAQTTVDLRDYIDGRDLIDRLEGIDKRIVELIAELKDAKNSPSNPHKINLVRNKALTELQFLKERRDIALKLLSKKLPDLKQTDIKLPGGKSLEEAFAESVSKSIASGVSVSATSKH